MELKNELAKTKYTGNYLNFIADESLIILLGLAEVPQKVISLYKLIQHPGTNENERQNALRQAELLGYGESKVVEIKHIYQSISERRMVEKAKKAPVAKTVKKVAKTVKKSKPKNVPCSGCGKKSQHKLPHNYGGLRRFIHLCEKCLPEIAPVIGHRLTHRPLWR